MAGPVLEHARPLRKTGARGQSAPFGLARAGARTRGLETAQKQAGNAERTNLLAEALGASWLSLDADAHVIDGHGMWLERVHKSASPCFADALPERARVAFLQAWPMHVAKRTSFELRVQFEDGELDQKLGQTFTCRFVPVQDDPAGIDDAWLVAITQQSSASSELALSTRYAEEERAEALRSLARGIAHQLNNLMHGVMLHAEIIGKHLSADSPARVSLSHVLHSALRGAEFGSRLLAFAGRRASGARIGDVTSFVAELVPTLEQSCVPSVTLRWEPGAGNLLVRVDELQLRDVLLQLLQNANEALATRGGTIVLRTGARHFNARQLRGARPGGRARQPGLYRFIEVQDDGPGMGQELLERVFEPFFANKFTGRGLGLPMVLGIVRTWGGLVDIRSTLGRGTCVRILLPDAAGEIV